MKITQTHRRQRERGSALLLTVLLTLAGAAMAGLTVDATSLVWVRSNAQTTANLAAAAVALELERNPAAPEPFLVESARTAARRNGFAHAEDSATVHLERNQDAVTVLIQRDAPVFFMLILRPQPVAVRARAAVVSPPKAAS
jgi:uncharacterized membrane protein